nr:periplasmic heavy metal sensor [Luteolibacter marinus]
MWATATVALAGVTAFLVSRPDHHHAGSEEDFHQWMHDQLHISVEQEAALAPFEKSFEKERLRLRDEIAGAGRALADAVRQGDPDSPEIKQALTRLNSLQAELQRATLEHFFAMKEHLDPGQAEKLLQWTHDSIVPE